MPVIHRISQLHGEMTEWRRHLHANPETAFEEHGTADFVAERLDSFGVRVHRGLAGTGVVGVLRVGREDAAAIGLRADMDALHVAEKNTFSHRSATPGKMHACGHDGHMAMLLGAAKYLAEARHFAGAVYFIFQPAEENEAGGRRMVADGLFELFPMDSIYGMHNMPGIDVGKMAVRGGPIMAACDLFEIRVSGRGAHAASPHLGTDSIVASARIVTDLQTVASRSVDPLEPVVVSVTQIHGGDTWNVIPEEVVLRGTARAFRPEVQDKIEAAIRRIVRGAAASLGVAADVDYHRRYPPTINNAAEAEAAAKVMAELVGEGNVLRDNPPRMGAEDFAFMLAERPGAYVWIGNGPAEGGCLLHNPHYDFNDEILPLGASYWAKLAEMRLGR